MKWRRVTQVAKCFEAALEDRQGLLEPLLRFERRAQRNARKAVDFFEAALSFEVHSLLCEQRLIVDPARFARGEGAEGQCARGD